MNEMYDAVIVGGGPAGLSAAIYLARAKCRVLVVEKAKVGGQITITADVVNYPGIEQITGSELTAHMETQAKSFGTEFLSAEVLGLELNDDIKTIDTTAGKLKALSIIIATGANPRKIGFQGEKQFQGRGVSYCATCDAEFFTGMDVFVVGGGIAAVEESIFISRYARSITMLVRGDKFKVPQTIVDDFAKYPNISVRFNTELIGVGGETVLSEVKLRQNITEAEESFAAEDGSAFGVFVFAGYIPNTTLFRDLVQLTDDGYVVTDPNQETNVKGVYAAGDVCVKNLRQVVTAVSDGAISATSAERHIAAMHDRLGLPSFVTPKVDKKRLEVRKEAIKQDTASQSDNNFISQEIRTQLVPVFEKFTAKVIVTGRYDGGELASELRGFMYELSGLTDKIIYKEETVADKNHVALELKREDGGSGGVFFHAVPGGHEFNSFILALYNIAGPGQEIAPEVAAKIDSIAQPVDIDVVMSLSCTMCPDVVMAAQRIAAANDNVTTHIYDIRYYPELKEKYKIMGVPCLAVAGNTYFGKKNIAEIADILTA